jgi:hypothetical protein
MRTRWLVAVGFALVGVASARAQPTATPAPTQLPPLLPVPATQPPPDCPPPGARPGLDYDPGYLYLPDRLPDRPRHQPSDDACGPPGRWWIAPELDLAWVPSRPAPANVQLRLPEPTMPGQTLPGPQLPVAGLSAPRFEAALGLSGGVWFGEGNANGLDASTLLRDANGTFPGTAPGMAVLFPNGTHRSVPQVVPAAPQTVGTFPATLGTFFATADVNYRHNLFCDGNARLDALAGYRYAFVGDDLYLGDLPDPGHPEYRLNRASVSNAFNGVQFGLAGEVRFNGWYAAGSTKVAFGAVTADVTATGMFAAAQAEANGTFQRLSALAPMERNEFAVMPTLGIQLGHQLGAHGRIYVNYSFEYLNRTARLGDALNPLNTGLALTDFWVQSIGFGAEFRY